MSEYCEFRQLFQLNTTHASQIFNLDDTSDSLSPISSDTESEVFENIKFIYTLIGIATKKIYFDNTYWWVVDIKEPDQLAKLNKPSLVGISGIFAFSDEKFSIYNKKVIVELTYNNKGYCLYKKNKIISLC